MGATRTLSSTLLSTLVLLAGCQWSVGAGPGCVPEGQGVALPPSVTESSGVAVGRRGRDVFWTHNDSDGAPTLYAVDAGGALLGQVTLRGARIRDWEDMAVARCGEGSCLWVADIGDNYGERDDLVLYRIPEPDLEASESAPVDAFPIALPDGPRDAEALFVLPGEGVHVITKGRSHPVTVYRYPPPLRPDTTVTLERRQLLTPTPRALPNQITGASASPDGRTVAVRSYNALTFYRVRGGRLEPLEGGRVNLRPLQEVQGEAVGLGPDGLVVLTSEAGPTRGPGGMVFLRCRGI